jgi:hypothetical protein
LRIPYQYKFFKELQDKLNLANPVPKKRGKRKEVGSTKLEVGSLTPDGQNGEINHMSGFFPTSYLLLPTSKQGFQKFWAPNAHVLAVTGIQ